MIDVYYIQRFIYALDKKIRWVKFLVPHSFKRFIWNKIEMLLMSRYPDRLYLKNFLENLPETHNNILWIGCRRYNKAEFSILAASGRKVTVVDIDPYVEKFSMNFPFYALNVCELPDDWSSNFDAIFMNGVFGDGLNEAGPQMLALEEMKRCLRPHGLLLIGLNGVGHTCYSATAHELLYDYKALKIAEIKKSNHQYYVL